MPYNDPANADVLAAIHAGHALSSILNIRHGHRVDVQFTQRTSDDYVPPKAVLCVGRPCACCLFPSSSTAAASAMTIRLADGTRIVRRMNLTHTVSDLRNFTNGCVLLCLSHSSRSPLP
ncbi:hypothetical protein K438DRAFT_325483 [Mycena galopus ATCC 62051]|nr:hypothetical protein K438DRAFT_325483 [Mycena galopus ATCC 62051]